MGLGPGYKLAMHVVQRTHNDERRRSASVSAVLLLLSFPVRSRKLAALPPAPAVLELTGWMRFVAPLSTGKQVATLCRSKRTAHRHVPALRLMEMLGEAAHISYTTLD
jgi:hypothetical protein